MRDTLHHQKQHQELVESQHLAEQLEEAEESMVVQSECQRHPVEATQWTEVVEGDQHPSLHLDPPQDQHWTVCPTVQQVGQVQDPLWTQTEQHQQDPDLREEENRMQYPLQHYHPKEWSDYVEEIQVEEQKYSVRRMYQVQFQ